MPVQASPSQKPLIARCESASKILKAMAHPQRLQILCHLSDSEKTVTQIEQLCQASQSLISQFLARMKGEKLLTSRREGIRVFYRISDERVLQLIQSMHKIFSGTPKRSKKEAVL